MAIAVRPHVAATASTTLWGRLPCAVDDPVLTVDAGTQISVDTVSHEGILEDQGRDPVAFFGRYGVRAGDVLSDAIAIARDAFHAPEDGPHVITGPIAVRGASVGDYLSVRIDSLEPRVSYGVISSRHGKGLLPKEFPVLGPATSVFCTVHGGMASLPLSAAGDGRPVRFPLAPFLGVMGVATPGDVRVDSTPPGVFGGNIDISLLRVGSILYLPVLVRDAGFYVGDPHFAQGNGEIALTALEAPLRATLTLDLVPAARARTLFGSATGPIGRTAEYLVPTGLHTDLDEAVVRCGQNAIELLAAAFGMDRELAYAYLSAATDFDFSQVVDGVKGVHARIRLSDFAAVGVPLW